MNSRQANGGWNIATNVSSAIAKKPPNARTGLATTSEATISPSSLVGAIVGMGRRAHDRADLYHCDTRHRTLTGERYIKFFAASNTEQVNVIIATSATRRRG